MVKNLPANAGDAVWFLGWEDPLEIGSGNPLQYSCLENPMYRGAWWATVHGVARVRQEWAQHTVCTDKSRVCGLALCSSTGFLYSPVGNPFLLSGPQVQQLRNGSWIKGCEGFFLPPHSPMIYATWIKLPLQKCALTAQLDSEPPFCFGSSHLQGSPGHCTAALVSSYSGTLPFAGLWCPESRELSSLFLFLFFLRL